MSRVFVTGDTHRNFKRVFQFCEEQQTTQNDLMIILGDAGINYCGNPADHDFKLHLSKMPISFFCIHGNHEMRPEMVSEYEQQTQSGLIDFGSSEPFYIEKEFPNIMFGIDGNIYDIVGRKCLVIGGAYSVDKYYRIMRGDRWFANEQPNAVIKKKVESKIASMDHNVDIVLSHTCPLKYIPTEMFLPGIDQSTVDRSTEEWLDNIEDGLNYNRWLCGHYHTDKVIDKIRFMFKDIVFLEDL